MFVSDGRCLLSKLACFVFLCSRCIHLIRAVLLLRIELDVFLSHKLCSYGQRQQCVDLTLSSDKLHAVFNVFMHFLQ